MIEQIVSKLIDSYAENSEMTNLQAWPLPSRVCVTDLTHKLESLLYPGLIDSIPYPGALSFSVGSRVAEVYSTLITLVSECLQYARNCPNNRMIPDSALPVNEQATQIAENFFEAFPKIRRQLAIDLHAAYKGDPAAKSYAEIILAYPGFRALSIHRLAHQLHLSGVPILPRMMSEYVHNRTGIDIHPGATIGDGLFIDHGTGVVIGETTVIGSHVKIYQGVTLGALSIPDPDSAKLEKRHPTIEDDVTIYANSTILGGKTTVGARSIVGSNVWLTHSVPPDTKILFVQPDLNIKHAKTKDYEFIYII